MRGKRKIFDRILVSVLILALALSNVSVAANTDRESASGQRTESLAQQDTAAQAESKEDDTENTDAGSSASDALAPADKEQDGGGSGEAVSDEKESGEDQDSTSDGEKADPDSASESGKAEQDGFSESGKAGRDDSTEDGADGQDSPEGTVSGGNAADDKKAEKEEKTHTVSGDALPDDEEEDEEESGKEERPQEEPLDFDGMLTLEELTNLPDETAESTMWETEAPAQPRGMRRMMSRSREAERNYSLDAYYVNQDDAHDVTQTGNFSLKYQMEFHTDNVDLPTGAVQIMIESALLTDRQGNPVLPATDDIGVPYGTPDDPVVDARTIFNHYTRTERVDAEGRILFEETDEENDVVKYCKYIDGEKTEVPAEDWNNAQQKEYLVFFNSRTIPGGTNAAWQVLYKNKKLMDLYNGEAWDLTPYLFVDTDAKNADEESGTEEMEAKTFEQAVAENLFERSEDLSLTGRIEASLSLTKVQKSAYHEPGASYTPGLYTDRQLNDYIKGAAGSPYILQNGRLNTGDYRFVVWNVEVKGEASQPWDLYIKDSPSVETDSEEVSGTIVGFLDRKDASAGYDLAITEPSASETASVKILSGRTEESFGSRFYVVTAYPAAQVPAGSEVKNEIEVEIRPAVSEGQTPPEGSSPAAPDSRTTQSNWLYQNYDWHYSGDALRLDKTTEKKPFTGWLSAYEKAKDENNGYGGLSYTTTGRMYGYSVTHEVEGGSLGNYRKGTWYTLTTADDLLYAEWTEKDNDNNKNIVRRELMGKDDYRFSGVTVTLTDGGYDVWEDRPAGSELGTIPAEDLPSAFRNRTSPVRIYAKFADSGQDRWELVSSTPMGTSGSLTFRFNEDQIARGPYRVMVEHDTIDYSTQCEIDVDVYLKADSPVMEKIMAAAVDEEIKGKPVQFVNLAGAMGTAYRKDGKVSGYVDDAAVLAAGDHSPVKYDSSEYGTDGLDLAQKTTQEYSGSPLDGKYEDHLLYRNRASRSVTWLTGTADSFKTASARNDVNNSRVLVDYCLTAYDGYQVYDRAMLQELQAKGIAEQDALHRTHVVFYDLLPYGMSLDASAPVTAGRIKDLDDNGRYKSRPESWAGEQVKVSVNRDEIRPDYRGTGRTLVVFRIEYEGADSTVYTNGKWISGWGVSFRAYYDWKDGGVINKNRINSNVSAFMPDFQNDPDGINAAHPSLQGPSSKVFPDNGTDKLNDPLYQDLVKEYTGPDGKTEGPGNIDGVSDYDSYRNVLYASRELNDDVATSSTGAIETLVRADRNHMGVFTESVVLPRPTASEQEQGNDGFYTYKVTVSSTKSIQNIVMFDCLEKAESFDPADRNDTKEKWKGTFRSVDVSSLEKMDINPVVYYSDDRNAPIPSGTDAPQTVLTGADKKWHTEEELKSKYGENWAAQVKAVAVDVSTKKDKTPFVLPENSAVSFQIRMQAPEYSEAYSRYTHNDSSYSYTEKDGTAYSTRTSSPARVGLSLPETLEIVKTFSGDVPASQRAAAFEFRLYTENQHETGAVRQPLAYTEYRIAYTDGSGHPQKDQALTTDGSGRLYLRAGEKAVFDTADAGGIIVEENAGILWKSAQTDPGVRGGVRTVTVSNTYRPVLYLTKEILGVPEGTQTGNARFTFQILTGKRGNDGSIDYRPLRNASWQLVDRADLSGGNPTVKSSGVADENGTFTIGAGEVIALFPGPAGTEYQLRELLDDSLENDWLCLETEQSGTMSEVGENRTFTNYYRWKELYLSKELRGLETEDYKKLPETEQQFTFKIEQAEGEELTPVTVANHPRLTLTLDGAAIPLNEDGSSFTCALGGRTLRIGGLEADKTYLVTEVKEQLPRDSEGRALYRPVNDSVSVKMPIYGSRRDAKIVNSYLRRSLSVSKTVVGVETEEGDEPKNFTFLAEVGGKPLSKGYTLRKADGTTEERTPAADGTFTLTDGQTAVFKDAGLQGDTFAVWEQELDAADPDKEKYQQIYPSAADGGAAAQKKDGYGAPNTGTFAERDAEANFVNGSTDYLYLSKEYVGKDAEGWTPTYEWDESPMTSTINFLKGNYDVNLQPVSDDASDMWLVNYDFATDALVDCGRIPVQFMLEVTDESGDIWTPEGGTMELNWVNPAAVEEEWKKGTITWHAGQPITMYPWVTVMIPLNELPENASYTLREGEEDRHWFGTLYDEGLNQVIVQSDQISPADDQPLQGKVLEKPLAVIRNELTDCTPRGSVVSKFMTAGSDPVPDGAELVWKVERYENGGWVPAKDIEYVVKVCAESSDSPRFDEKLVSGQLEKTGDDGRIRIEKTTIASSENAHYYDIQCMKVGFLNDYVFLGVDTEEDIREALKWCGTEPDWDDYDGIKKRTDQYPLPLLRLVELTEESAPQWGGLVGYWDGASDYSVPGYSLMMRDPDKQMTYGDHAFVNSNRTAPLEIGKNMPEGVSAPDETFTLLLRQVVSVNPRTIWQIDKTSGAAVLRKLLEKGKFDNIPGWGDVSYEIKYVLEQSGSLSESIEENGLFDALAKLDCLDLVDAFRECGVNADYSRWFGTQAHENVSYTVYDSNGRVGGGRTGRNGEVRLRAGQYAVFDLSEDSVWLVSEDESAAPMYRLKNLEPNPGSGSLRWLNDNLMLVHMKTTDNYMLSFDLQGGTNGPDTLIAAAEGGSHTFRIPEKEPVKDGCVFLGWAEEYGSEQVTYKYDSTEQGVEVSVTLRSGEEMYKTLFAVWKEISKLHNVVWQKEDGGQIKSDAVYVGEGFSELFPETWPGTENDGMAWFIVVDGRPVQQCSDESGKNISHYEEILISKPEYRSKDGNIYIQIRPI